jgi:hypothetical protein
MLDIVANKVHWMRGEMAYTSDCQNVAKQATVSVQCVFECDSRVMMVIKKATSPAEKHICTVKNNISNSRSSSEIALVATGSKPPASS